MRLRVLTSVGIGLASGSFCWYLLGHFRLGAGDFGWSILAAQDLLAHKDPYQRTLQLYPLPAALFGLPFIHLRGEIAGGLFYGLSSALLSFGLTKESFERLLVLLAYPYWAGILTAQWSPLIMASVFLPLALPAALAKPQIGLPVIFAYRNRKGLIACALVATITSFIMPLWPLHWAGVLGQYQHFIPIMIFPGPLLALAIFRWRKSEALLLLSMAVMPQRWFYDAFVLWLIPKSRREIAWTALISWGAGIWRWYHVPHSVTQVGRWTVVFTYLPMLWVVLSRWGHQLENRPELSGSASHLEIHSSSNG